MGSKERVGKEIRKKGTEIHTPGPSRDREEDLVAGGVLDGDVVRAKEGQRDGKEGRDLSRS